MILITEQQSASLVTDELAYESTRRALVAAIADEAESFPTVLGHGSNQSDRFTIKSAAGAETAGLKVGSYWPGNAELGIPRHNSTILLFDQRVGAIGTVIQAGTANGYRTAAADAVATDALARPDSRRLTIFGSGHQAFYECRAIARIRHLERISVVARDAERGAEFVQSLCAAGLPAQAVAAEAACREADIIVTATTAREPLFDARWVSPGTHVSSMGSDRTGKQELPVELLGTASLFCDLPSQSRTIGEFQHAAAGAVLTALGHVLTGVRPGRVADDEITVFDSSGIALQDLYLGLALIEAQHAASI